MTDFSVTLPKPFNVIDGQWVPALWGGTMPVLSPSDGPPFAETADIGAEDVEAARETFIGRVRKSGHAREKDFAALHESPGLKTIVHNHG